MIIALFKFWNFLLAVQEAKVARWIAQNNFPPYF